MRPPIPSVLAAVVLAAACVSFGGKAEACNPGPKPGPSTPLVSIDLSAETITATSGNASISPIDYGNSSSYPDALMTTASSAPQR
jgi:hypothetical protein